MKTQTVNPMVQNFQKYAKTYGVTFASAVRDRDYPMNRAEVTALFVDACGRAPTEIEIKEMGPDGDRATAGFISAELADYNSIYK